MRTARADLERLRAAHADGRLETLCREHGLELVVLFGSAVAIEDPGDSVKEYIETAPFRRLELELLAE